MFYKILQRFVVLNLPQEITPFNTITRGHDRRYQIPFSRIDVHKFSFFPATVKLWNSLPDYAVKLDNLGRFRTTLMDCVAGYFSPSFLLLLTWLYFNLLIYCYNYVSTYYIALRHNNNNNNY